MNPEKDDLWIQDDIKGLLSNWRKRTFPESRNKDFIARLYNVREERRHIIEFPLPRQARAFVTVGAGAFMVLFAFNYFFAPQLPAVSGVRGAVKVCRAGTNEWKFVEASGMRLGRNDTLKTFGDGQADIVMPRSYHIRLKRDSEIKVARLASRAVPGDIRYELVKGKAFNYYARARDAQRPFNIVTPEALVSAVGTDFMVEAVPQFNKTWVGVLDGVVRVSSQNVSVLVEPGEKTVVSSGAVPEKPSRLIENELLELEELYRIGTKPQVALLISTGKNRTRELLSAAPLYVLSGKEGALPGQMREIVRALNRAAAEHSREKYLANIRQFEEFLDKHPDPKYNVQIALFIAAYYEHLDEHARSIEAFRKVIDTYPDSRLASIAQCAMGIVYEEKLADAEQARQAYRNVLSRYPASPEVEEAAEGLKRLEVSGGVPPPAVAGPARSLGKYRKEYLKGKYRSTISVKEGKVVVAPYDEARGPDYANGTMLSAGQQTEVVGRVE